MTQILLDSLEIGMELNADVIDRQGRTLLKSGVLLTEKHLRVFQTWGVLEADIKGDVKQGDNLKVYSPELIEKAKQLADIHFQHNDITHPVVKNLYQFWQQDYLENKA